MLFRSVLRSEELEQIIENITDYMSEDDEGQSNEKRDLAHSLLEGADVSARIGLEELLELIRGR